MVPIRVMSRREFAEEAFTGPVAVVSIRSPGGPEPSIPDSPHLRAVLRLEFDDVDDPREGVVMSAAQAAEVLAFARTHLEAGAEIVCQCEAGVSRSAGVAAALCRIHFGHDGSFHRTHRPNAWVRRMLLATAREQEGGPALDGVAPEGALKDGRISQVLFLPTALPTAVLVRDGVPYEWAPRLRRTYPAGTLGGERRTLAAHVFVPLLARDGRRWTAREIGSWTKRALHERAETGAALVITRAGAWRSKAPGAEVAASEPGVEVYVQTAESLTRDAWTKILREVADAIGARFGPERFDVVLSEDGLMYKRAVWRPAPA